MRDRPRAHTSTYLTMEMPQSALGEPLAVVDAWFARQSAVTDVHNSQRQHL